MGTAARGCSHICRSPRRRKQATPRCWFICYRLPRQTTPLQSLSFPSRSAGYQAAKRSNLSLISHRFLHNRSSHSCPGRHSLPKASPGAGRGPGAAEHSERDQEGPGGAAGDSSRQGPASPGSTQSCSAAPATAGNIRASCKASVPALQHKMPDGHGTLHNCTLSM